MGLSNTQMMRLLITSLSFVTGQDEFDCKPRPGCHIAKCDPVRLPFPENLQRNEYPIVCVEKSSKVNRITWEDYQSLWTVYRSALQDLLLIKADATSQGHQIRTNSEAIQTLQANVTTQKEDMKKITASVNAFLNQISSLQSRSRRQTRRINLLQKKVDAESRIIKFQLDDFKEDLGNLTSTQTRNVDRLNEFEKANAKFREELDKLILDQSAGLLKMLELQESFKALKAEITTPSTDVVYARSGIGPRKPDRQESTKPVKLTETPIYQTSLQCNFDTTGDLCGLQNSLLDDFDWKQNFGKTSNPATGPKRDRTKRDKYGGFVYIDGRSPRKLNDLAVLETPKFAPGSYCTRFSVHMFGEDTGDVQVRLVQFFEERNESRPLWYRYGNHRNAWEDNSVHFITSPGTLYMKLEFRGWRGKGPRGDSALDDVKIEQGSCRKDE